MARLIHALRWRARYALRVVPNRLLGTLRRRDLDGGGFAFRPGTCDRNVYDSIVVWNEYRLPRRFAADDVIVDVGGHIGSFAYACLIRGAGRVHVFEPEPGNLEALRRNLAPFADRVVVHAAAAWRSDAPATSLRHSGYSTMGAETNTGGGNVLFSADGVAVPAEPLDGAIEAVGGPIRLLKLDCEGSEFPILLTSRRLDRVRAIAGEFHEIGGPHDPHRIPDAARVAGVDAFTIDALAARLREAGFAVRWRRHPGTNLGAFFARRHSAR